jgi:transposase
MKAKDARSLSPDAQQDLRERVIQAIETQGLSPTAAAQLFGLHRCTVSTWYHAYRRQGAEVLASQPRGRKPKPLLSAVEAAKLTEVWTRQTPEDFGLADTLWTRETIAAWAAQELGLQRTRWVWGRWLKAHGITPQKPSKRAWEQDRAAVRRWLDHDYPRVVREAQAEDAELHWGDQAGWRSDCQVGRTYAPQGQTPVAQVPGKRFRVNYIATLTNLGVVRFLVHRGRFTAALFVTFLRRLLADRPGKVYVLLDNHPVHHSRKVRDFAAARPDRLRLVFLPPYSPELNPAELLNNDVKGNAPRRGRPRNGEELAGQARSYLRMLQRHCWAGASYFRAPQAKYAAA